MSYTKLFNSIITSTIWSEDDKTRIVWITMMALADKNGEVMGSIPGLARVAGVAVEDCRSAVAKFLSPDPDSRTTDDEGRRIEIIDGGWHLLNHQKYREMATDADRAEKAAIRQSRKRAKDKEKVTLSHDIVTPESRQNPQAEAEAEAEAEEKNTSLTPKGDGNEENPKEVSREIKDTPAMSQGCPQMPHRDSTLESVANKEYEAGGKPLRAKDASTAFSRSWKGLSATQRKQTRVNYNTERMIWVGKIMGRSEKTLWSVAEAIALEAANPSDEEISSLMAYYHEDLSPDTPDYRRRDLVTLLNNWLGELDRARGWKSKK